MSTAAWELIAQASYPEGPFFLGGRLHFVEYSAHRLRVMERGKPFTLWEEMGSGPASGIADGQGDLILTLYDAKALLRLTPAGLPLQRVATDLEGGGFLGPNDLCLDRRGNVYFTDAGPFEPYSPSNGRLYVWPRGGLPRRVAGGLHYPNGVGLSPDGRWLYVSEHLGQRLTRYRVLKSGDLEGRQELAPMTTLSPDSSHFHPTTGPDGLHVAADGRIWIAQFGAARLLVANPDGSPHAEYAAPQDCITNLCPGVQPGEWIVTAFEHNAEPYDGAVWRFRPSLLQAPDAGA